MSDPTMNYLEHPAWLHSNMEEARFQALDHYRTVLMSLEYANNEYKRAESGRIESEAERDATLAKVEKLNANIATALETPCPACAELQIMLKGELAENRELMDELATKCACRFNTDLSKPMNPHACEYHKRIEAERDRLQKQYNELLYAVTNKHPGKSRHATALRYIREGERYSLPIQEGNGGHKP